MCTIKPLVFNYIEWKVEYLGLITYLGVEKKIVVYVDGSRGGYMKLLNLHKTGRQFTTSVLIVHAFIETCIQVSEISF